MLLIKKITRDFPQYKFIEADFFKWSNREQAIYFSPDDDNKDSLLLHELGHALLEHSVYHLDIELIRQEAAAWEYAIDLLAQKYSTIINISLAEDCLDSYREWLYGRSLCQKCGATGLQKTNNYSCLNCSYLWRANEARTCGLKRFKL